MSKSCVLATPKKSAQYSKSLFLQKSRFCSSQSLRSSFGRGSWNALHPVRALRLHTTLETLHRSTQRRCGSQNFATWRIWYAPDRQHPTNSDFGALIHASDAMRQQALRQPTPTFSGQKVKHQKISIYLTHVFLDSMMFSCSSSSKKGISRSTASPQIFILIPKWLRFHPKPTGCCVSLGLDFLFSNGNKKSSPTCSVFHFPKRLICCQRDHQPDSSSLKTNIQSGRWFFLMCNTKERKDSSSQAPGHSAFSRTLWLSLKLPGNLRVRRFDSTCKKLFDLGAITIFTCQISLISSMVVKVWNLKPKPTADEFPTSEYGNDPKQKHRYLRVTGWGWAWATQGMT